MGIFGHFGKKIPRGQKIENETYDKKHQCVLTRTHVTKIREKSLSGGGEKNLALKR